MSFLGTLAGFFNDQSVAAFMGAFAAFSLVVVNDRRRARQKVENMAGEIRVNLSHAESKLERVRITGPWCVPTIRSSMGHSLDSALPSSVS